MSDAAPDPGRCPLCGEANRCALALPPESRPAECWCVARKFPRQLTERADPTRCICERCLVIETDA